MTSATGGSICVPSTVRPNGCPPVRNRAIEYAASEPTARLKRAEASPIQSEFQKYLRNVSSTKIFA